MLEIDLASYFDSIDRGKLLELLQRRVADGTILQLVGKCMHVGVLDGEEYSRPEVGTAQGSTLSPLLGNIYLHYVLDLWFTEEVKPRLAGKAMLCRYADDAVFGFERQDDAERVKRVLEKRLARFGLKLNHDKTRLLDFRNPRWTPNSERRRGTFDYLGFTWYWRRTRRGSWMVACKTRRTRQTRIIRSVYDWCRGHRYLSIGEQYATLARRVQGHYNYFGVNGNVRSLQAVLHAVERVWFKWLNRRSQRASLTWQRFQDLLRDYPLPAPRVIVDIWSTR